MVEERPIRFHLLNKDELQYEVAIRDEIPETTVEKLRGQIRKLSVKIPTDEVSVYEGSISAELSTIASKLTELESLCDTKPLLLKKLRRIQALGNHLFHRLSRVEPVEEPDLILKSTLDDRLLIIVQRMDRMLHTFQSSFESKPEAEISSDQGKAVSSVGTDSELVPDIQPVVTCDRSVNVHSFNIKFCGKGSVLSFIQRIEELCVSRNVSEKKLFNSVVELFSDQALLWFRGIKNRITDWKQLKDLLLDEYLPVDYDYRLLDEIRNRTQGAEETILEYFSIMQNYFLLLRRPLSEVEKLEIFKFNIRPFYSTKLALEEIKSLDDLKHRCRQLEAAKYRAENFKEPVRNLSTAVAPDLTYKGRSSNKNLSSRCEAVGARGGKGKFCVRCRIEDHDLSQCKAPPIVICYRCGEKGVTSRTCSKCSPKVEANNTEAKNS